MWKWREGKGDAGGGCGCFCLWHPSAQLKRSFLHTHTHTHIYTCTRLTHTLGPTSKSRHARVHPPQHTHASHAHKQKRGQFHKHSCTHTHTHTLPHAAQHWHTVAVMKPEENGTISYYFQCSNLEGMCLFFFCFFFLPTMNILILSSELLGNICILYIEHWSSPHWNELFFYGFWERFEKLRYALLALILACLFPVKSRFQAVRNQICSTTQMLKVEHLR